MRLPSPLAAALMLVACTHAAPPPGAQRAAAPTPAPPVPAAVDAASLADPAGESMATAIAVPAEAKDGGSEFENRWIFDRYGRFRRSGSGTGSVDGRRYNVVKIELANGEHKSVYFDITENWDRWSPKE